MPSKYQDKAPKLVKDPEGGDAWLTAVGGDPDPIGLVSTPGMPFDKFRWFGVTYEEARKGCYNGEARLADMDIDGVDAEILFPPQRTMSHFLGDDDDDFVLAGVEAYNNFLFEEFCAPDPKRLIGLAQIPSLGIDNAVDSLRKAKARGAKGVLISNWPSGARRASRATTTRSGPPPSTRACPVSVHINIISRAQRSASRKAAAAKGNQLYDMRSEATRAKAIGGMSHVFSMATGAITDMIFTGVFDRFPELQVCWIETGVGWIPHFLECLDDRWWRNRVWGDLPLKQPPSYVLVPQQRRELHRRPHRRRAAQPRRRRQHDVVERLSAPRQRLAVLAQDHRRDDGRASTRRRTGADHRRQRGADLAPPRLGDSRRRVSDATRTPPTPVPVCFAVRTASSVSRWIVRLVHVVQDAVDGGDHASRVRGELALDRDELVLVPLAVVAREHGVHVGLEGAEVAHVDRAELDEDVLGHADLAQLDDRAEQCEVAVVVALVAERDRVGEQADLAQPFDECAVDAGRSTSSSNV